LILHWNGAVWKVKASPNPGGTSDVNSLSGVAATSSKNAWAVGFTSVSQGPLILHWNGTAWKVQKTFHKGVVGSLTSISASSATNAWAVGAYFDGNLMVDRTLIAHWNGTAWKLQPSPNVGMHSNDLSGVAATSTSNAWAVGNSDDGTAHRTLMLHWNGTAWKVQPTPNTGAMDNDLYSVAATSAGNAWAVGEFFTGTVLQTVALHCC
jgi:hypothetical protein